MYYYKKTPEFINYIIEYFKENKEELVKIKSDFKIPCPLEILPMVLGTQLNAFSHIIISDSYPNNDAKDRALYAINKKDFDILYEVCIFEWKFCYATLELNNRITKKTIKVPLRNTMADIMYSVLATYKIFDASDISINTKIATITTPDSASGNLDKVDGFNLPAILILRDKKLNFVYDTFNSISVKYIKWEYLTNNQCKQNIISDELDVNNIFDDLRAIYDKSYYTRYERMLEVLIDSISDSSDGYVN